MPILNDQKKKRGVIHNYRKMLRFFQNGTTTDKASSRRIAISINTSWNIINFRKGLITALQTMGYEVIALAPPDEYTPALEKLGCRFVPIQIDSSGINPIKDAALFFTYLRCFRQIQPTIYLGYTIKPNVYGTLAASAVGIPVINNVSGLGTAFLNRGALQRIVKLLYRKTFVRSKHIFFQNKDDQSLFIDSELVAREKTSLLPGSGVDLTRFAHAEMPASDSNRPFHFLFFGRVLRDKGIIEFVEATRRLKAEGLSVVCTILGFLEIANRSAIDSATMQSWIAEGIIEHLGATSDVRPYIAAADCVVLPSYREGTPKSLLEAAAMGKPLITTDVPGCREVVEHRSNGLLCRAHDSNDLAAKMREMMNLSLAERMAMSCSGRKKMEQEFDERIVVSRYIDVINANLTRTA